MRMDNKGLVTISFSPAVAFPSYMLKIDGEEKEEAKDAIVTEKT